MNREIAGRIMENLRTKFRAVNQIYDLTKELDAIFSSGDQEQVDMLLEMRMNQIELGARMNMENEQLLRAFGKEGVYYSRVIRGRDIADFPDGTAKEIYLMAERIYKMLEKTRAYDKIVADKLRTTVNKG